MLSLRRIFLCTCLLLVGGIWVFSQDTVTYTYDNIGDRLTAEKEPAVSEQLAITHFVPQHGLPGSTVIIYGRRFIGDITANIVRFNGVEADVLNAAPTVIVAVVPQDATTGLISVQNINGTAFSNRAFSIMGITVSPATLELDEKQQFTFSATVTGADPAQLVWYVNDVQGGNATIGIINTAGLYTAPEVTDEFSLFVTVSARIYTAPGFYIQDTALVSIKNLDAIPFTESSVVGVRRISNIVEGKVVGIRKMSSVVESKPVGYRKIETVVEGKVVSYSR